MTRRELDFARARIDDFQSGTGRPDPQAIAELAGLAGQLLGELERLRTNRPAIEQQAAHAALLGDAKAALAAAHAGFDPTPWLEHALAPYGGVPAGAVPEQLAADAAALAAEVSAPC